MRYCPRHVQDAVFGNSAIRRRQRQRTALVNGEISLDGVFPSQREGAADDLDIAAVLQRRVLAATRILIVSD